MKDAGKIRSASRSLFIVTWMLLSVSIVINSDTSELIIGTSGFHCHCFNLLPHPQGFFSSRFWLHFLSIVFEKTVMWETYHLE